jgi:hypothetical protein
MLHVRLVRLEEMHPEEERLVVRGVRDVVGDLLAMQLRRRELLLAVLEAEALGLGLGVVAYSQGE